MIETLIDYKSCHSDSPIGSVVNPGENSTMSAKHYWLVAGNVLAAGPKGQIGQKGLNTLVRTTQPFFAREDMAAAQDGLMRRFVSETPQEKGGKIVDVFLLSVSHLGEMTEEQFEGSFATEAGEPK
jgi:hypothetical protein